MDNFDLRKYLVENRVTTNSRLLAESENYHLQPQEREDFNKYIDTLDKYREYPDEFDFDSSINFDRVSSIIIKSGTRLFDTKITQFKDHTLNVISSFYKVTDPEALQEIARLYAEDEDFYSVATDIQKGKCPGFEIITWISLNIDKVFIMPLKKGFENIEAAALGNSRYSTKIRLTSKGSKANSKYISTEVDDQGNPYPVIDAKLLGQTLNSQKIGTPEQIAAFLREKEPLALWFAGDLVPPEDYNDSTDQDVEEYYKEWFNRWIQQKAKLNQ